MDLNGDYSYYPPEPGDYYFWANWVNRPVFESFKKHDEMSLPKHNPGNIPNVKIAYAVKVIPGQDLTICGPNYWNRGEIYKRTQLYVVDDTGEELFNKSIDSWNDDTGLAMLDNQTYRLFSKNMPQMFIPQATIVHFTFYSRYGSSMSGRLMFNNLDIILDEQYNIILARYDNHKFAG